MGLPHNELTVDVGFTATAWAYWRGARPYPEVDEFKRPRSAHTLPDAMEFMHHLFCKVLDSFEPKHVWLEGAELWTGSEKSQMSAAKGHTFMLSYLVGVYAGACLARHIDFDILLATQWKGTLTKEGTAMRVERILGASYSSDHITDAVAIGLSRDREIWHLKKGVR